MYRKSKQVMYFQIVTSKFLDTGRAIGYRYPSISIAKNSLAATTCGGGSTNIFELFETFDRLLVKETQPSPLCQHFCHGTAPGPGRAVELSIPQTGPRLADSSRRDSDFTLRLSSNASVVPGTDTVAALIMMMMIIRVTVFLRVG